MYKQIKCIDILQISTKLKISINKLSDKDIQYNIKENKKEIFKNFPSLVK
jgi:hypothetical protein